MKIDPNEMIPQLMDCVRELKAGMEVDTVHITFDSRNGKPFFYAGWPYWCMHGDCADRPDVILVYIEEGKWNESVAKFKKEYDSRLDKYKQGRIHSLASVIISTTHKKGNCGEADLRAAGFPQEVIDHFVEEACELADTMSANKPFTVYRGDKPNTPPEGIPEDAPITPVVPGTPMEDELPTNLGVVDSADEIPF